MKVKVLRDGYFGEKLYKQGDVFDLNLPKDQKLPSWVVSLESNVEAETKAKKKK